MANPREVVVVNKGPLEELPPVLSVANALPDCGVRATVVCSSVGDAARALLEKRGVRVVAVGPEGLPPRFFGAKLAYWSAFRRGAWRAIESLSHDALLWVSSVDGALCLGGKLRERPYVLQCNELYDKEHRFRLTMGSYISDARVVVVPEASRGAILRSWFALAESPTVLPNKASFHPRRRLTPREAILDPSAIRLVEAARRVVLYQGRIARDRNLLPVARAVSSLGTDWVLMMMGRDFGPLKEIMDACPTAIHVPHRAAPEHLRVTATASIGVLAYDYSSLNNVFCAPNKLWEYSGFGIPMLAQDLPGLTRWIDSACAGRCVDYANGEAVGAALRHIDEDYERLAQGATRLYESVDVPAIICDVLERCG